MDEVDLPRSWRERRVTDVAYAALVIVLLVLGAWGEGHPTQPEYRLTPAGTPVPVPPAWAYGLVAVAAGVLVVRRSRPAFALVVSVTATAVFCLLGYVSGAAIVAPVLALLALAGRVRPRRALLWSLGTLVVLATVVALNNPLGRFGGGFVLLPALVAAAYFAGVAAYNQRALLAAIADRGRQEAQRQVDAERLRIARELHDVVAHTMATINVQATAAVHVLADRPEAAAEAMRAVRAASKEGLRELRAVLDVLRRVDAGEAGGAGGAGGAGEAGGAGDAAGVAPAPGLGQLDGLVDRARQAGLPVTLTRSGSEQPLPAEVDLAVYRIVQESLTNTIRHAGPATAHVCVEVAADAVRVEVTDTGTGPVPAGAPGLGLVGMRERVASLGGSLEAGPGDRGGFRVAATLPLRVRV